MGNFFQSKPSQDADKALIKFLSTKTQDDIRQIQEIIDDQYPAACVLNFNEFEDIFGTILESNLEQVFLLLQNDHKLSGVVDIYESLTVIIVFSSEVYSVQLAELFKMFDFDKSDNLEIKEMVLSLQTTIRALCKIVNIPPPDLKTLESAAQTLFLSVDSDKNNRISYQEFESWICSDWDLQDFLLKYAGLQTLTNAKKRGQSRIEIYDSIFNKISEDSNYAGSEQLQTELTQHITKQLPYIIQILNESSNNFAVLCDQEPGKINRIIYKEIMTAVAAYDATDINQANEINQNDIQYLFYVFQDTSLNEEQNQQVLKDMSLQKNESITLQQWLEFLDLKEGKSLFQISLKNQFLRALNSTTGMSLSDTTNFINKQFHAFVTQAETLSQAIIDILKDMKYEEDQIIEWNDLKEISDKLMNDVPELGKFQ